MERCGDPLQPSADGVVQLLVSGQSVIADGAMTAARRGTPVRRAQIVCRELN